MSASCIDKEPIAPIAVQHYNFLKWIVVALLAALLLGLLGKSCAAAALAAPTISVPSGTIDPQAVTLTGTGAPNSQVVVEIDGEEFVADVDGNGDWSLTTETLTDGDYTARVAAVDLEGGDLNFADSGDWSVASAVVEAADSDGEADASVAALVALGGLTLGDFAADDDLTSGSLRWRGTGEPGATVELLANGEVLDRATVDADGNWVFNNDYNFAAGDVDFSARMIGADGDDLGELAGNSVAIPDLSIAELDAPTLRLDSDGDVVEGDEITFSGTASPNADIEILLDGKVVEMVSADADGNFTYSTSTLPAGDYALTARNAEDGQLETDAVAFNVEAMPTAAPPMLGRIFGGSSADDPIEFSGSAEAGREVELFVDGESIGTVVPDADGNFTLSAPVGAGERVVTVRYVDDEAIGSDEQAFTVADVNGVGGAAITTAMPNEDGTVSVSGTAPAGSEVEIISGDGVIGTVSADDDGNFSIDVTLPDDSNNTIGAQTTDENGVTIGFDSVPVATGALVNADDGDGAENGTGGAGDSDAVDSSDETASGDASDDDVAATDTGGSGSSSADDSGSTSGDDMTASGDDTANDNADDNSTGDDDTATDSGSDDDSSDSDTADDSNNDGRVVVTDVAPVNDENGEAPTIGTVDFGMSGTGRPGELVIVLENGEEVGGATVQADGRWSCTCILPPGEHILIVQEANNPDNRSEPVVFVVENLTEAPTPPRLPPGTTSTTPPIVCTGEPPYGEIRGHIYIVAQCESLSLIALRLGTTVDKMMAFNPQLATPSQIYPGQPLNIPGDAGCFDNAGG